MLARSVYIEVGLTYCSVFNMDSDTVGRSRTVAVAYRAALTKGYHEATILCLMLSATRLVGAV